MNEKDFEYLTVLARTGNITKAAEQLFVSQAALSKRVKAMETELGAQLFVRGHQGIHLTAAGEKALQHISLAAQQLSLMKEEIGSMGTEVQGRLKAGITVNYSFYCLPDLLDVYSKKYPKVQLEITTAPSRQLYNMMLDGKLDVAILRGSYSWDGIQYLLSQEPIFAVRNFELVKRPLSELMYIDCNADVNQEPINRWLQENGISTASSHITMDNLPTCMAIIQRGLGWGLIPEIALTGYYGSAVPCFYSDNTPLLRRTYLFCQSYAQQLPQTKAFIDLLLNSGSKGT